MSKGMYRPNHGSDYSKPNRAEFIVHAGDIKKIPSMLIEFIYFFHNSRLGRIVAMRHSARCAAMVHQSCTCGVYPHLVDENRNISYFLFIIIWKSSWHRQKKMLEILFFE